MFNNSVYDYDIGEEVKYLKNMNALFKAALIMIEENGGNNAEYCVKLAKITLENATKEKWLNLRDQKLQGK